MSKAVREAQEEAAERELAGRSDHGARALAEAIGVLAGLERALTVGVAQRPWVVVFGEGKMVPLTEMVTDKRSRSGRVHSMARSAAANGGLGARWNNGSEEHRESGKGGWEP